MISKSTSFKLPRSTSCHKNSKNHVVLTIAEAWICCDRL
jgi:hypothetical protein